MLPSQSISEAQVECIEILCSLTGDKVVDALYTVSEYPEYLTIQISGKFYDIFVNGSWVSILPASIS